jgi:hypothetical protein
MYGGTKRSYKQMFISLVSVLLNGLVWCGAHAAAAVALLLLLREEKGERNANLIPHEPLAALYSQDRAEYAHGGTPAARTSGA